MITSLHRLQIPVLIFTVTFAIVSCVPMAQPTPMNTQEFDNGIGKPSIDHFPAITASPSIYHTASFPHVHIQSENKLPEREVLGFYTDPEPPYPGSQPIVDTYSTAISQIAPFWYKLDENRPGFLLCSVTDEQKKQVINTAHAKGIHVYLLVHNLFYGTVQRGKEVAHAVLTDKKNQDQFIKTLKHEINKFHYDGISVDMENLFLEDRDAFSSMIKDLSKVLHKENKVVTVSVAANSGDSRANPWAPWFDYGELGKSVDRLILMVYDEHNPRSQPGPVASVDWVESTIRYALNQGVTANRILIGVAGYGWNWGPPGTKAVYSSYDLISRLQQNSQAFVNWDQTSQAPYFSYRDEQNLPHQVWYENSYSLRFKLALVDKYNLRGIAVWRLGLEDPAIWHMIEDYVQVRKLKLR